MVSTISRAISIILACHAEEPWRHFWRWIDAALQAPVSIWARGCEQMAPKLHPRTSAPTLSPARTDRGLDT